MEWIIVAIGGGVGATLRYLVQLLVKRMLPSYWATVLVNVIGSLLLGLASNEAIDSRSIMTFLTIGFLGAFTTFSTFAFEMVELMDTKKWGTACLYISMNLIGGILAFSAGWLF